MMDRLLAAVSLAAAALIVAPLWPLFFGGFRRGGSLGRSLGHHQSAVWFRSDLSGSHCRHGPPADFHAALLAIIGRTRVLLMNSTAVIQKAEVGTARHC